MEHSQYLNAIKKALKARAVTYVDLATQMKMTESGVKKMLNAKDISFRRVLQICEALDILPGQLFSMSEKTFISEVKLTPVQEEALLKNRNLLAVYWRLAIEGHDVSEIEKLQNLNKAELKKLLDRLVSLELLSLKRGTYKSRHSGKFKWSDNSKLAKTLNKEWSELTLQRSLDEKSRGMHRLVAMKLTTESYANMILKITEVLDEAVRESEREELTTGKQRLHNSMTLVATVPQGVFDI
ncbi:hypothetical protein D3C87_103030 [compost metagenome]